MVRRAALVENSGVGGRELASVCSGPWAGHLPSANHVASLGQKACQPTRVTGRRRREGARHVRAPDLGADPLYPETARMFRAAVLARTYA